MQNLLLPIRMRVPEETGSVPMLSALCSTTVLARHVYGVSIHESHYPLSCVAGVRSVRDSNISIILSFKMPKLLQHLCRHFVSPEVHRPLLCHYFHESRAPYVRS